MALSAVFIHCFSSRLSRVLVDTLRAEHAVVESGSNGNAGCWANIRNPRSVWREADSITKEPTEPRHSSKEQVGVTQRSVEVVFFGATLGRWLPPARFESYALE